MSQSATPLLDILSLQPQGEGLFTADPVQDGLERVFGGQLLGQALAAATHTAPEDWPCHSLHAYFVRPGKPGRPIDYEVSALRDGQRLATRKVIAVQRNEVIFELTASFESEEAGAEYQEVMPSAPSPESFPSEDERIAQALAAAAPEQRRFLEVKRPIEFIKVDDHEDAPPAAPLRYWMRLRDALPDDARLHRCALAYASDMGALQAAMRAGGLAFRDGAVQVASLDHALWLHRDFRFDDWLLFTFHAISVSAGRGLSRGMVHTRHGIHVASLIQEGMMRARTPTRGGYDG
jgi:acyl-CoA thioesterase-2